MNRSSEVSNMRNRRSRAVYSRRRIYKHCSVCARGVIMRARIGRTFQAVAFRKLSRRRSQLGRTLDRIPFKAPNRWHNDGLIGSSLTALPFAGTRLLRFITTWLALIDGSRRRTQSLESYYPAAFRELRGSSMQLLRLLLCYRATCYRITVIDVDVGAFEQMNCVSFFAKRHMSSNDIFTATTRNGKTYITCMEIEQIFPIHSSNLKPKYSAKFCRKS